MFPRHYMFLSDNFCNMLATRYLRGDIQSKNRMDLRYIDPSLILNSATQELLTGNYTYDVVEIINGSTLYIGRWSGGISTSEGEVQIEAMDYFYVDSTSDIWGRGYGFAGGRRSGSGACENGGNGNGPGAGGAGGYQAPLVSVSSGGSGGHGASGSAGSGPNVYGWIYHPLPDL